MNEQNPYARENSPRSLKDYLMYPRVLLTLVLLSVVWIAGIGFGIYALFFNK